MSVPHLTLGALYREMRAGLGDAGRVRVTVEFQQLTVAATTPEGASDRGSLVLETLVEYEDRVLDRAEVALYGSGPAKRFMVGRHATGYAYSVDGGDSWGRFTANPRIFVLEEFEAELGQVEVEDATFEVRGSEGSESAPGGSESATRETHTNPSEGVVDALDVTLDREAFLRLLAVFAADIDASDDPGGPSLSAFSVSMEAAEDISLQYWWSLSDSVPTAPAVPLKVRCSVSIRVGAVNPPELSPVRLDESLPDVGHLDEVWGLLRRGALGRDASGDEGPAAGGP